MAPGAGSLLGTHAGGIGEHARDEQARERVGEGRGGLARILVEAGDRARQPAHRLLGLSDERWWLLVQARGLEQRRRPVVDDRQPLFGGVAVRERVEFERSVTPVQDVGRVGLGGVEKSGRELRPCALGQRVNEVNCDAERGGGRDRGREEGDRPLRGGVGFLAEELLATAVGRP